MIAQYATEGFILQRTFAYLRSLLSVIASMKGDDTVMITFINAFEFFSGTDWPVHGIGGDSQFTLDMLQQLKRIHGSTVHFVDKGKYRYLSQQTYLEQLLRLCLDTLGCIDHHDGRIGSHQGTIGILREILMSRGIQNVDTEIIIFKLQHRACNGNTSLLFDFHPVTDRMLVRFFSLYTSGRKNRPAIQQQLLRQRCFSGIRMGYDGEGSPPLYFIDIIRHTASSYSST